VAGSARPFGPPPTAARFGFGGEYPGTRRSSPGFFDGCAAGPNNVGYWLGGGYDRSRFACIPGHGGNTAGGSRVSTAATAGGRLSIPDAGRTDAALASWEHKEAPEKGGAKLVVKGAEGFFVRPGLWT